MRMVNLGNHNRRRAVIKISKKGRIMKKYKSIQAGADDNGLLKTSIANCLSGRSQMSGGYKWRYL